MLQLLGYRMWNLSGNRDVISLEDVTAATAIAQRELEGRVFMPTLFDLSQGDINFLKAMLEDERTTLQSKLPERLGKQSGHVTKYKKRLLEQGIIQEPRRGQLEFCLPGFREYLMREEL